MGSDFLIFLQKQEILKDVTNTKQFDAITAGKSKCLQCLFCRTYIG